MVQSKMFDQNSSKLTTFHIPHTNSRTATKLIIQLLILVNMNSSSIPTPTHPSRITTTVTFRHRWGQISRNIP